MLDLWPATAANDPRQAHLAVWCGLVALQVAAAIWYAMGRSARGRRPRDAGAMSSI
ncbi:hypothetical protein ACU4GD_24975 [Cupriavidus basilensis]